MNGRNSPYQKIKRSPEKSHLNKLVYERTSYMNKIYKVVWNNTLQCYTVVSELAKSHTKNNASKVVKATVLSSLLAVTSSTYAAQGGGISQ